MISWEKAFEEEVVVFFESCSKLLDWKCGVRRSQSAELVGLKLAVCDEELLCDRLFDDSGLNNFVNFD